MHVSGNYIRVFTKTPTDKDLVECPGINLLSLLYHVASGVSPGQMSGQLFVSWWVFLIRIILMSRSVLFSDRGEGYDEGLVVGEYCAKKSGTEVYVVSSSCEMRVGVVLDIDVFLSALCLGCLQYPLTSL